MLRSFLTSTLLILATAHVVSAQVPQSWTPAQEQVWRSVQARWDAWVAKDFRAFADEHHPDWQRWSFSQPDLMSAADLEALWDEFTRNEEYVGVRLEPIKIDLFADGRFAATHYIAHAHVRWLGEPFTAPSGRRVQKGDETTIPVRWSDFLVKEADTWLYVGGYRDGNCGLWPGYNRPCAQDQNP